MASDENDVLDPLADPEERRVLFATLDSFGQYRQAAHYNITHLRRQSFYSLPNAQIDLLSEPPFCLPAVFNAVDDAIDSNADISEAILQIGLPFFGLDQNNDAWKSHATPDDLDKARSTVRQLYRDWSAEGAQERHAAYTPILSALDKYLPTARPTDRSDYRVLVPGAGLGRLVLEICCEGYCVEGNEISYHQLLASNYMLNCIGRPGQHKLFPWALNFSNHLKRERQLQSVLIPDIHPGEELQSRAEQNGLDMHFSSRMSMSAGDFSVVYRSKEQQDTFDAVATCFFIDTAPNVINYIETIKNCLKAGGVWINVGPLLWHFESTPTPAEREKTRKLKAQRNAEPEHRLVDKGAKSDNEGIGEPGSFELSNEEVMALVTHYGFEILEQKQAPAGETGYISDPESLLRNVYRPTFWVARLL